MVNERGSKDLACLLVDSREIDHWQRGGEADDVQCAQLSLHVVAAHDWARARVELQRRSRGGVGSCEPISTSGASGPSPVPLQYSPLSRLGNDLFTLLLEHLPEYSEA